ATGIAKGILDSLPLRWRNRAGSAERRGGKTGGEHTDILHPREGRMGESSGEKRRIGKKRGTESARSRAYGHPPSTWQTVDGSGKARRSEENEEFDNRIMPW
ncbi:MAG: hypothetical protein D6795_16065, partial [Deltaproteobacteria bacterium]